MTQQFGSVIQNTKMCKKVLFVFCKFPLIQSTYM